MARKKGKKVVVKLDLPKDDTTMIKLYAILAVKRYPVKDQFIKTVLPRIRTAAFASRSIPVPQVIVQARLAFIIIAPARTLTLYIPVVTLQLNPVAPHVNEIGPRGLPTIYLGTASADAPGTIIVSTEPPTNQLERKRGCV